MRVAILETVKTNGGFEQEFDRLIFNELKTQGHEPVLYLPEHSSLPVDFNVHIEYLEGGKIIQYEGASKLKKIWLSIQREKRRVNWFNAAYQKAQEGKIDAILLTTATYRYLRSLHKSKLKDSPIPIIFIFLGVNPKEKSKFLEQARKCRAYSNIKLKVTSLRNDFKNDNVSNVKIIPPPVLVPKGIAAKPEILPHNPLRVGFFGHYRKGEKNIQAIIKAFVEAKKGNNVEFYIQLAPTTQEDLADVEQISFEYQEEKGIHFIKRKLLGQEWYQTLQEMDVIFLPYNKARYLYNWSAVYFNALGLYKPVIVTNILNPEILQQYQVGITVDLDDEIKLVEKLKYFISSFNDTLPKYNSELQRVNDDFSTARFLANVLN